MWLCEMENMTVPEGTGCVAGPLGVLDCVCGCSQSSLRKYQLHTQGLGWGWAQEGQECGHCE